MSDSIFYNKEGYIEVIIEGDQTYMMFQELKIDAALLLEKLRRENKPVLGLIDISKEGKFSSETNRAAMQILESLNYDKVAIFGASKILEEVTKAIILAMGKMHNTKIFRTREEAIKWLLEPKQ